jgi:hypothetical protein
MSTPTLSNLVGLAGDEGVAANDDRAEATGSWKIPHIDVRAGWDPYEVWRTRVKNARSTRDKPDEPGH